MRYRPFGRSGIALSTIGVYLCPDRCQKDRGLLAKLINCGLENGINAYYFKSLDYEIMRQAAHLFGMVDRKILFIGALAHESQSGLSGFSYEYPLLKARLKWAIKDTGLSYLDLLAFDHPTQNVIPEESMVFLQNLRRTRMVQYLAAIVGTDEIKDAVDQHDFQTIITSFNIDSNWDKRRFIDYALAHDMSAFGMNYFPDAVKSESDVTPKVAKRSFLGLGKAPEPLAGSGSYAFLHKTPDWSAEELCLGYALAQPVLSCIWVEPENVEHLEALASVPERHMPSSVPAQIEMARFSEHETKASEQLAKTR
jgi:aryl-alcohol dehydrogenase-like predicted oxidoreductase